MTLRAADLSVVIPTKDRPDVLRQTLAGLAGQSASGFEVLVVADGGNGPSDVPAHVRVIHQEQAGPGVARNTGAAQSRRPLLLFLGDDMVPTPHLVAEHLDRHARESADEVAVLGLVRWHPTVPHRGAQAWLEWSGAQFDFVGIDGDDAGWGRFYSCNVSLKRTLFDRVGGFDPDFTYYYEDLDIAWRLNEAGMRLRFEPRALALHLHRYDLDGLRRRFAGIAVGEQLMQRKHPEFEPYFAARVRAALAQPRSSPVAAVLMDRLPQAAPWVARLRRQANTYWYQQVGPAFVASWEGQRDLEELTEYLGDSYNQQLLWGHRQAVDEEEEAAPDESTFYRTSQAYLYDLTVFAMTGTKDPYRAVLRALVPPGARLLDYGCGIGSDGLRLLDAGYRVEFADFDNPSTEYLRWRLARRGYEAAVHDLDAGVPGGFDAAYCFDVIEHVPDPYALLEALEQRASIVVVNLLEPDPADTHLHKPLPIRDIVSRATRRGLLRYRVYHERSHLLAYRGDVGRADVAAWRSRANLCEGLLASRLPAASSWVAPLARGALRSARPR